LTDNTHVYIAKISAESHTRIHKMSAEWSTEERLQELKGKLNLKERDNEAYFRYSQEKIHENDDLIGDLRSKVKQQRELLSACLDGDRDVINTALNANRLDVLSYNRVTASKCIEEKNQDVFDQVKKLNSVQHKIRSNRTQIKELELTLKNLKTLPHRSERQNKTTGHDTTDQRVRVLSTRLDKVLLKINSARYVNTTYKRLLSYLEKDSLSLPSRLDDLEACLEQQKNELSILRKIHGESKTANDTTKYVRRAMEDEIMNDKAVRDQKLSKVRRSVKQLNDEAEQCNIMAASKPGRTRTAASEAGFRSTNFTADKIIQKEAMARALDMLKDTVGASSIDDIATNFAQQLTRQQSLLTEAEDKQKVREQLQARLALAEKSLKTDKFGASVMLSHAHDPESELEEKEETVVVQMQQLENINQSVVDTVQKILLALDVFYAKCCELDHSLPMNESNPQNKVAQVIKVFGALTNTFDESNASEQDEAALVDSLPSRNLRVELPDDDDEEVAAQVANDQAKKGAMFNDDDDQLVETTFLSRDDIKKKSGEIVRINTTKKKH